MGLLDLAVALKEGMVEKALLVLEVGVGFSIEEVGVTAVGLEDGHEGAGGGCRVRMVWVMRNKRSYTKGSFAMVTHRRTDVASEGKAVKRARGPYQSMETSPTLLAVLRAYHSPAVRAERHTRDDGSVNMKITPVTADHGMASED